MITEINQSTIETEVPPWFEPKLPEEYGEEILGKRHVSCFGSFLRSLKIVPSLEVFWFALSAK